jgi:hypothetical protein
MLASVLIIAISAVLFCYWFRYTCMLILSTKTSRDYAGEVATANQLQFVQIQGVLRKESQVALDPLMAGLDRDFSVLNYLLRQTASSADSDLGDASLEQYMLRANFWAMRTWFRIARQVSESAARSALQEMSLVVNYFANSFGERVAAAAQA